MCHRSSGSTWILEYLFSWKLIQPCRCPTLPATRLLNFNLRYHRLINMIPMPTTCILLASHSTRSITSNETIFFTGLLATIARKHVSLKPHRSSPLGIEREKIFHRCQREIVCASHWCNGPQREEEFRWSVIYKGFSRSLLEIHLMLFQRNGV